MTLASVEGQPRAVQALRTALRSGAVPHAYLFAGPVGVGKELCAIGLAQALNCPEQPGEGCGTCSSCVRIARRSHPDISWVMPEAEQVERKLAGRSDFTNTPSRDIRIEQIRSLQERLSFHPLEGKKKVAIFASAEAMNPPAQNAFLKTLEEPPPETVLILVTALPEKLAPTIRSRCSRVFFGPLPAELIAAKVQAARGVEAALARTLAVLADGSLSRALDLDVKEVARRTRVIEQFDALERRDARGWLRFAEEHGASRDDAAAALEALTGWTRDVAVQLTGAGPLLHRELGALATSAATRTSPVTLHRQQLLIDQALNAITARNGSPRLHLERFLIELFAG